MKSLPAVLELFYEYIRKDRPREHGVVMGTKMDRKK
jgi:hypothetical protein